MSTHTPLRPRSSNDGWQPTSTTPLRIAKRDSPQPELTPRLAMARRNSTSWRHVIEGSRVSKSPFKTGGRSGIPTPSRPSTGFGSVAQPRRVSGEKRPRTMSMNEQGENEHPAQRKRRQSQGLQGLANRKPVTKSPFRATSVEIHEDALPALPQPQIRIHAQQSQPQQEDDTDEFNAPPPPPKEQLFVPGRQSPHRTSPSPSRPSLVSRRLHGPRTSLSKRQRRKTVTFDETCDVMEYDVEEDSNSQPFEWVTDEDPDEDDDNDNDNNHETPVQHPQQPDHDTISDDERRGPLRVHNGDESFDSLQLGEDSITGLVNSMLQDARPHTPPHDEKALPVDVETEDGVPIGRTHHAERAAAAHRQHTPEPAVEDSIFPIHNTSLSTPTRVHEGASIGSVSPGSHIPLGRTTHVERMKAHKEKEREEHDEDDDVSMLPPSPSPSKRQGAFHIRPMSESALPRFSLDVPMDFGSPSASFDVDDSFGRPSSTQEIRRSDATPERTHSRDEGQEGANNSFAHSDISLSGMDFEVDLKGGEARSSTEEGSVMPNMSTPPTSPPRHGFGMSHDNFSKDSLLARLSTPTNNSALQSFRDSMRSGSPAFNVSPGGSPSLARNSNSRSGSPFLRGDSPLHRGLPRIGSFGDMNSPTGSTGSGRSPRITRENVQRILEKKRSIDSPLRDKVDPALDFPSTASRRSLETAPASPASDARPKRTAPSRVPPPKMTRDNPTYDGVMSINPEPQPNDPPRPSMPARSASFDGASEPDVNVNRRESGNASTSFTQLGDMKSALDRLMADVAGEARMTPDGKGVVGLRVEAVTEGVKAGRYSLPENEDGDAEMADASTSKADAMDIDEPPPTSARAEIPMHIDLPPLEQDTLLHTGFMSPETTGNAPPIRATSPPPPVKDAIRVREELIKAKKREARRREEEEEAEFEEYLSPRRPTAGRPSRRRSMSTGDAEDLLEHRSAAAKRRVDAMKDGGLLDNVPIDEEDPLADSIDRELRRLKGGRSKYHIRERSETIYASSDADKVAHMGSVGDVANGQAWRAVRRPSDMNEYSKQLKELRAQEGTAKAYGKVFVKVVGVKGLNLPIPSQPTAITCTLNNGIHFVTTPEVAFGTESRIDQEFELIEHSKLEFTLTIKVRRDPHIITQFKAHAPPPPPLPVIAPPPASKGGMRSFFSSKKAVKHMSAPTPVSRPPTQIPENLARYLKPDGTLARAFIAFKDIARRCDTKLFETSYPLIGQRLEPSGTKTMQVGELVLQIFRLPPLPGIPQDQLPQSLEDCHRGLRHVAWHKVTYFEGTLTQNGGDCTSWRRRHLRVIGSNLVAFNDVTKKAISSIDLKKAVSVEDDEEARRELFSPASAVSARSSRYVEFDGPYGVERSFRLLFPNNQTITFFADTDDEKSKWLDVLRALVGRIPPNPLWAEVLWQRQQEGARQRVASPQPTRTPQPRPQSGPSRIPEPS